MFLAFALPWHTAPDQTLSEDGSAPLLAHAQPRPVASPPLLERAQPPPRQRVRQSGDLIIGGKCNHRLTDLPVRKQWVEPLQIALDSQALVTGVGVHGCGTEPR